MSEDDHEALIAGQADMRAEMRELRAEIERLRAALHNIAIGGNGERNWTLDEVRAVAWDALQAPRPEAEAMTDMPMSPRMYATLIMERLRDGGIAVPLSDEDGYTVQDIITDHIERAISDARRALQP